MLDIIIKEFDSKRQSSKIAIKLSFIKDKTRITRYLGYVLRTTNEVIRPYQALIIALCAIINYKGEITIHHDGITAESLIENDINDSQHLLAMKKYIISTLNKYSSVTVKKETEDTNDTTLSSIENVLDGKITKYDSGTIRT